MKIAKYLLILCACLITTTPSFAQTEDLKIANYQVHLNGGGTIANQRDKAMRQASREGFALLLKRMTPRYAWNKHADIIDSTDTDQIVTRTQLLSEDQQNGYSLTVDLYYDRDSVRNILKKAGVPFTEKSNPRTLMLAVYQGENMRPMLWEEQNPWRDALKQAANEAAMEEVVFPLGEIEEVSKLTPQMAKMGTEDIVLKLAQNYDATQAVVATVTVRNGFVGRVLDVEGQVYGNGTAQPFYVRLPYGEEDDLTKLLSQAAHNFYARMEEDRQQNTLVEVDRPDRIFLRYHPVDLEGLLDLEETIKSIDRVKGYKLRVVSIEDSIFQVDFYGDKDKFKRQLEAEGLTIIPTSMDVVWGVEKLNGGLNG